MTNEAFRIYTANLINKYGSESIDGQYVEILYKVVRDLSSESYRGLVEYIIGEHPNRNWPPKISQIREYAMSERKKLAESTEEKNWRVGIHGTKDPNKKLDLMGHDNVIDLLNAKRKQFQREAK